MKTYLLKFICLVALVSFFGCSTEDSEEIIEDNISETFKYENGEQAPEERKSPLVTILVECPGSNPFNTCINDLGQHLTIYSTEYSSNCNIYMVQVNRDALYEFYGVPFEDDGGPRLNHILRPPFGTTVPTRPPGFIDYYEDCFGIN